MQVGRRVLDRSEREGFDRAVRQLHQAVHGVADLVEALELQVVLLIVHERQRRDVAFGAAALAHEHPLTGHFPLVRLAGIEPPGRIELRRRRKVDVVLHLRHHRGLVVALRQMHALALRARLVAIEIGGALLELAEILDRAQRPLRAMDLLVEEAAQADRIQSEARRLRSYIGRLVKGGVRMEIRMAVETGDAEALVLDFAFLGLVELLLRKWGQQQTQPFHLHRGDKTDHHFVIVLDRQQPAARHVAQFGMGGEKIGGGNSGVKVSGRSKSTSKRRRLRPSWVRISSI